MTASPVTMALTPDTQSWSSSGLSAWKKSIRFSRITWKHVPSSSRSTPWKQLSYTSASARTTAADFFSQCRMHSPSPPVTLTKRRCGFSRPDLRNLWRKAPCETNATACSRNSSASSCSECATQYSSSCSASVRWRSSSNSFGSGTVDSPCAAGVERCCPYFWTASSAEATRRAMVCLRWVFAQRCLVLFTLSETRAW